MYEVHCASITEWTLLKWMCWNPHSKCHIVWQTKPRCILHEYVLFWAHTISVHVLWSIHRNVFRIVTIKSLGFWIRPNKQKIWNLMYMYRLFTKKVQRDGNIPPKYLFNEREKVDQKTELLKSPDCVYGLEHLMIKWILFVLVHNFGRENANFPIWKPSAEMCSSYLMRNIQLE